MDVLLFPMRVHDSQGGQRCRIHHFIGWTHQWEPKSISVYLIKFQKSGGTPRKVEFSPIHPRKVLHLWGRRTGTSRSILGFPSRLRQPVVSGNDWSVLKPWPSFSKPTMVVRLISFSVCGVSYSLWISISSEGSWLDLEYWAAAIKSLKLKWDCTNSCSVFYDVNLFGMHTSYNVM